MPIFITHFRCLHVDIDAHTPEAHKVREYKMCYDHYLSGLQTNYFQQGFEKYLEYLGRCDLDWVYAYENFEDLQQGLIRYYTENGTYDKMAQYYSGCETPLRDDGNIMTTALSFSVNCTKKRLMLKFWYYPKFCVNTKSWCKTEFGIVPCRIMKRRTAQIESYGAFCGLFVDFM